MGMDGPIEIYGMLHLLSYSIHKSLKILLQLISRQRSISPLFGNPSCTSSRYALTLILH